MAAVFCPLPTPLSPSPPFPSPHRVALQEAVFRLKPQDSTNLAERGRIRRWLYLAVTHRFFDYAVFILIFANCITLSLWWGRGGGGPEDWGLCMRWPTWRRGIKTTPFQASGGMAVLRVRMTGGLGCATHLSP